MKKLKKQNNGTQQVRALPPTPVEISIKLESLAARVESHEVKVDEGRLLLGISKEQMKPFAYAVQLARLLPELRSSLPRLLGLPEPQAQKPPVVVKAIQESKPGVAA